LILDYDDKASLNTQGNGAFTEVGASVIVNSNNPSATVSAGNGTMKADEFFITGGLSLDGNGGLQAYPDPTKIYTGMHPTPDPLAYLPEPPVPPDGKMTKVSLGNGNWQYILTPGRYTNLPNFNTGDVVVFNQASTNSNGGIFYIDGGGLHSTGATLKMGTGAGGMMIYNKPASQAQSQKIQITGNPAGEVVLSGLDSGPYRGIALWQDRTSDVDILVEGNGNFNIYGTFYAAGAKLNINGNGKTDGGDITSWYIDANGNKVEGSRIATQYVSRNLSLGGNGNIHMNYTEQGTAKTRIIALVE
jgi:hypothetical protein